MIFATIWSLSFVLGGLLCPALYYLEGTIDVSRPDVACDLADVPMFVSMVFIFPVFLNLACQILILKLITMKFLQVHVPIKTVKSSSMVPCPQLSSEERRKRNDTMILTEEGDPFLDRASRFWVLFFTSLVSSLLTILILGAIMRHPQLGLDSFVNLCVLLLNFSKFDGIYSNFCCLCERVGEQDCCFQCCLTCCACREVVVVPIPNISIADSVSRSTDV